MSDELKEVTDEEQIKEVVEETTEEPKQEIRGERTKSVVLDEFAGEAEEAEVTSETPEPEEGEVGVQEDVIAERRQALKEGLIEPETLEGESQPIEGKDNRDSKRASNIASGGAYNRPGMSFGGPGLRRKKQQNPKPPVERKEVNPRRGTFKIWDDRPVNNVGGGTSTTDIPQRRKKD